MVTVKRTYNQQNLEHYNSCDWMMTVPSICYTKINNKHTQISTSNLEQHSLPKDLYLPKVTIFKIHMQTSLKHNASDVGHKRRIHDTMHTNVL